ncbi:MAG: transferrin receptor-like dimerization domain-containing protein [Acidobacteriota bacterium]
MEFARRYGVFLCGIAMIAALLPVAAAQERMTGYSPRSAAAQREIEEKYRSLPSAEEARSYHRFFTAEPHPAGSARNNELARHIARLWKEQGWEDVRIHRYDVMDTHPRSVTAEMIAPVYFKPSLREDPYDIDADTKNPRVRSAFTGMSASGEVTASVVYANSGNPQDYELLRKHGIDVRGKIVLVRYSNPYSYRGFKALTAEREGAAAIIIYSDPAEDGYHRGKVFPEGPWGPESHIQRGAITYDFLVAGDPLTPGWPSTPGAKRISPRRARSVPRIIALPMSWRDARPLLENMDGPEAPREWQGGLPIKYRLGGAAVRVHLKVSMDNSIKPNYVVEARLRGSEFPDEWIVMGNHRDAWEFGGVDPSSGTASMMEMTRALGELKRQGIRPKRTLVVCSWDGEEVALTGSTEWGEHFAREIKQKMVAYINVDSSVSGPNFRPSAVASLAPLIIEVSRSIGAPSGRSLYEEWKDSINRERKEKDETEVRDSRLVDVRIGSGSDHTVFLNHLGRPTVGLTFEGPYGVYHSVYDNHYWMTKIGDPGFRYHALMSVYWGTLALRLANADVLPFDFVFYADKLREFVEEIANRPDSKRYLDLSGVLRRLKELKTAAEGFKRETEEKIASDELSRFELKGVNRRIFQFESNWLHAPGIPDRPWFKHLLYAARYTYAHLELPALTEAVENGNWVRADHQARILEAAIAKNIALLGQIEKKRRPQAARSRLR